MSFLLTGQTDSGKSTIAGRLLYEVGYFEHVPDDDKKAYRTHLDNIDTSTSKSKYSILMDLMDGEILANKTKTQDFTPCPFTWKDRKYLLVDTPGHQLYIRSLLEALFAVKQLEVICVVISAIPKEFSEAWEKGTTKENMLLGRAIGCKKLLILWNKTDISKPPEAMMQQVFNYGRSLTFPEMNSLLVSGYQGTNILQILDYVRSKDGEQKEKEEKQAVTHSTVGIYIQGMFFQQQHLVLSRGFQCMLHHYSGEFEVELDSLVDLATKKPIPILRDAKPIQAVLMLNRPLTCSLQDRVILRHKRDTIGFGNVIKHV